MDEVTWECTKIKWNETDATRLADHLNRAGHQRNPYDAYPCRFCGGWHLGRKMTPDDLDAGR
jgi:hypothetical protein